MGPLKALIALSSLISVDDILLFFLGTQGFFTNERWTWMLWHDYNIVEIATFSKDHKKLDILSVAVLQFT